MNTQSRDIAWRLKCLTEAYAYNVVEAGRANMQGALL